MPKISNRPKETSLMSNYSRSDLAFVSGKGVWLFDKRGKMFLDLASGIAVNSLGHSHPRLVKVLADQGSKLWHTSNLYTIPNQEKLAKLLTNNTFAEKVFFTNSGAESVECAIKVARRFFFSIGQSERNRIISFEGSFHGRTMGTISAAGSRKLLEGFGPRLPGFDLVKKLSLESVEKKISRRTCAILVEPIFGEGGIVTLSCSFLKGLKNLCEKYNLLLIFDEVQSGVGRSGHFLAHESCEVTPDIVAMAKGLGNGFPIGACLATKKVAACMVPGTHGSTYGGNPLACAVALETAKHILKPNFLSIILKKGHFFKEKLDTLLDIFPKQILEVRGKGLMLGLKCAGNNVDLINMCREENLLLVPGASNTVRILPPLIITYREIEEATLRLQRALVKMRK
ncbi:aspartate aminotransferase family protein [Paracoccaceae bacterium]|nr:aspartate aminotransferase family protein [Paracoccaceae bacterium]